MAALSGGAVFSDRATVSRHLDNACFVQTPEELSNAPTYALPEGLYWGNYVRALINSKLLLYILNSFIVAALTIGLTVILAAPAAFAIEKLRFAGSQQVLTYFLLGLMIPAFVALPPMFQAFDATGLRNIFWAVVLPQVGFNLPIAIYIYTGFMRHIPDALLEAASIDGASTFKIFTKIVREHPQGYSCLGRQFHLHRT
jgi:raffinose/stachyose/melibiose transport system permease protein